MKNNHNQVMRSCQHNSDFFGVEIEEYIEIVLKDHLILLILVYLVS